MTYGIRHCGVKNLFKTTITICLLLCASVGWGTDWYVRPSGGTYGTEDGTSYENAWDGFSNITWGSGGVVAGDTLWICGIFYEELYLHYVSGASGNEIIIDGSYTGANAIISAAKPLSSLTYSMYSESPRIFQITTNSTNNRGYVFGISIEGERIPWDNSLTDPSTLSDMTGGRASSGGTTCYVRCDNTSISLDDIMVGWIRDACRINGQNYYEIKNIIFQGPNADENTTSSNVKAIFVYDADYITFDKCILRNACHYGIDFHYINVNHCEIKNSKIYGNLGTGIYLRGAYCTADHCVVYNNAKISTDTGDAGGIGINGDNASVTNCMVYDNGPENGDADFEISCVGVHNTGTPVAITNNIIYNARQGGIQVAEMAGGGGTITGNLINTTATSTASGVARGKFSGIRIGAATTGDMSGIKICNNTIVNVGSGGVTTAGIMVGVGSGDDVSDVEVRNNIIKGTAKDIYVHADATTTGLTFSNNSYYKSSFTGNWHWKGTDYNTLPTWQTACGSDAHSITSAPKLNTSYYLKKDSPCIDAGTTISGVTDEYYGDAVDIGWKEYKRRCGGCLNGQLSLGAYGKLKRIKNP